MNIRDITEGPGWNAFKTGAGQGLDKVSKGLGNTSGKNMTVPSAPSVNPVGTAIDGYKGTPSKTDKDDKAPNQNLEYLKLQSAIMRDKKLTPEQKLQKLDQLLQQQIQQAGR
tara:strand:+ start:1450 stop:1785 length:336 start_codon:yes stop_codon:yes gene_type:complete